MLSSTVSKLRCPVLSEIVEGGASRAKSRAAVASGYQACGGGLRLSGKSKEVPVAGGIEIRSGTLECESCGARFPILAGVAVVVTDVNSYILNHVKGLAKLVAEEEIPVEIRDEFVESKDQIESEHIEEDLEADRVVSLYVMNHYLRMQASATPGSSGALPFWAQPDHGTGSPLIEKLIRDHWDQGPFSKIAEWFKLLSNGGISGQAGSVIEIGAGVGGLCPAIGAVARQYLGVDSSFASVAIARHLALGLPYDREILIPGDLLQGPVSRHAAISVRSPENESDFVVGEIESLPVVRSEWDVAIALNAIDMMPEPGLLPRLQYDLLKKGGIAVQSCPYIWHEQVARELREALPADVRDSAQAVESLYEKSGLSIETRIDHLPWLFFKHLRQLEIYSVHLFKARKN